METLLSKIRSCTLCQEKLPLGPRPIVVAHPKTKIVLISQAPGLVVHQSGIPWADKGGENLRAWMGIDKAVFYDQTAIGVMPMGFCYPGRGKSGDNPPTKECAPQWHSSIVAKLEAPRLILLIGKYAQEYYLGKTMKRTLTESVKNYQEYLPQYFVLPHPSPRNNSWQAKNKWFTIEVLPELKRRVAAALL